MDKKVTISDRVFTCYEYVELAERAAVYGAYEDSNRYWQNAVNFANSLLINNEPGTFLDEEYDFLQQIAKHFKDGNNA